MKQQEIQLIEAIKRLQIHDHLCLIYEKREEQFAAVIPFIRIGIERGEKCVYIADDNTASDVMDAMRADGIDVDSSIKSGSLSIITKKDAYLRNGYFDPDMMIKFLKENIEAAKTGGYKALRASGEMTWALGDEIGVERLLEYEAKLNYFFPGNDIVAICQYNRSRFSPDIILDVIHTHPLVIYGAIVCKNMYYVPPDEFLTSDKSFYEVERLLRNIIERTSAEETMRESEEKYRTIFEESFDGLFITSRDGKILDINRKGVKMFGYDTKEEMQRLDLARDVYDDPLDRKRILEMVNAQGSAEYEVVVKKKNGEKMTTYCALTAVRDENGVIASYRGIIRDITEHKRAEESIRESEERFKAIFDNASDGILLAEIETRKFYMGNRMIYKMLGYTETEIKNLGVMDIHPEADLPYVIEQFEKQARREIEIAGNIPVKRKDKSVFFADINSFRITLAGKEYLAGIFRDVTERNIAEDSLRKSEERLKEAQHLAHIGNWELDIVQDKLYWSDEVYRIFDMAHQAFGGSYRAFLDAIHPEDRAMVDKAYTTSIKNRTPYEITHRLILADGRIKYVNERCETFYDNEGKPQRSIGTIQDITGTVLAEEALRESEEKFRIITSSASDAIIMIGNEGEIVYWNEASEKMFGYTSQEAIGKELHLFLVPERYRKAYVQGFGGFRITGEGPVIGKTLELTAVRKAGEEFPVELAVSAVKLRGKWHSIGIVRDITGRKRAEEERVKLEGQLRQAQKMEAIGQLAGGVAHDFNNVLSAIMGYAHLLHTKLGSEDPSRTYAEQILESVERAASLTHSLLAFSRKQAINPKPVNLNDSIQRVGKLLLRLIGEDIELATTLSKGEINIFADPGQIDQVLMNLATNARDAMPRGGTLTIGSDIMEMDEQFVNAHGYGKPGKYCLVSVSDTGVGMNDETMKKMFEPFFTTKEVGKGTGLGLAMVYGIVKQHNGYINAYSEVGKGTTFKIYLPLFEPEVKEQKSLEVSLPPVGGSETILVAEDDPALLKLSTIVLSEFGYTVIQAKNGEEAVQRFKENKDSVRLLVLDMTMPKKSGKEAYEEIRKIMPDIKTLFMTGYTADVMQKQGIFTKEMNLILKPVSPKDLLKKVREILDGCK